MVDYLQSGKLLCHKLEAVDAAKERSKSVMPDPPQLQWLCSELEAVVARRLGECELPAAVKVEWEQDSAFREFEIVVLVKVKMRDLRKLEVKV